MITLTYNHTVFGAMKETLRTESDRLRAEGGQVFNVTISKEDGVYKGQIQYRPKSTLRGNTPDLLVTDEIDWDIENGID